MDYPRYNTYIVNWTGRNGIELDKSVFRIIMSHTSRRLPPLPSRHPPLKATDDIFSKDRRALSRTPYQQASQRTSNTTQSCSQQQPVQKNLLSVHQFQVHHACFANCVNKVLYESAQVVHIAELNGHSHANLQIANDVAIARLTWHLLDYWADAVRTRSSDASLSGEDKEFITRRLLRLCDWARRTIENRDDPRVAYWWRRIGDWRRILIRWQDRDEENEENECHERDE